MDYESFMGSYLEVGIVGKIKYRNVIFKNYSCEYRNSERIAFPDISDFDSVEINVGKALSVKEMLFSLCSLYISMQSMKSMAEITKAAIDWCCENGHPYNIEEVFSDVYGEYAAGAGTTLIRDATFSLDDFLRDLAKLGKTFLFYYCIDMLHHNMPTAAYELYNDDYMVTADDLFKPYPFFEQYKYADPGTPKQQNANYEKMNKLLGIKDSAPFKPEPQLELTDDDKQNEKILKKYFASKALADYGRIMDTLIDMFPDMRTRLKRDADTGKIRIMPDVNSIFDIAWIGFAKIIDDDPQSGAEFEFDDDIYDIDYDDMDYYDEISQNKSYFFCQHCKKVFPKRPNGAQYYCSSPECQKAHAAARSRASYRNRMKKKSLADSQA